MTWRHPDIQGLIQDQAGFKGRRIRWKTHEFNILLPGGLRKGQDVGRPSRTQELLLYSILCPEYMREPITASRLSSTSGSLCLSWGYRACEQDQAGSSVSEPVYHFLGRRFGEDEGGPAFRDALLKLSEREGSAGVRYGTGPAFLYLNTNMWLLRKASQSFPGENFCEFHWKGREGFWVN